MPTRIESLIADCAPLSPTQYVGEVMDWFLIHTDKHAMAVVFERTLVGVITRHAILGQACRLDAAAAASQPIMPLIDVEPVMARSGQPLGEVAHAIASEGGKGFEQGVVVTHGGAYYGFVSPASLGIALSEENTRRAQQMRAAAQRLQTMNRQSRMQRVQAGTALARLGHEVRTPLTAMLGHTERLLKQNSTPKARRSLEAIARSTEALAELVSRTVEAGQAGAGRLDTERSPFTLKSLADGLCELWTPRAEQRNIHLDIVVDKALPARLEGDAMRIVQILGNLISNAIKYAPDGDLSVHFSGREREEGQVAFKVQVSDSGPGIADKDVPKLFQPFQRLSLPSEFQASGAGLGLSISRDIARAMDGDIDYARGVDGGSVFTLTLPLRRAGPRLATETTPQSSMARGRAIFVLGEILLIEDHAASQALIESTLNSAGWRVDTVSTLAQARRKIDQKTYQAILCDYFLRDGQGDVLIKMLRGRDGPNRDTLCLAVTADSSQARRRHCMAAGFAGVIAKPIRGPELVTTLADYINASGSPLEEEQSLRA
jgi:signal transduction histidine kinase/ActR/RegA family two-component response regulator